MLGSDGKTVGRVRDIYQQDAGGELAAITVMPRQLSAHSVLIPAAAISALPAEHLDDGSDSSDGTSGSGDSETQDPKAADVVRLRIDTVTAKAGLRPPHTGHASPQVLREATEALGLVAAAAIAPATPAAHKAAGDA